MAPVSIYSSVKDLIKKYLIVFNTVLFDEALDTYTCAVLANRFVGTPRIVRIAMVSMY